VKCYKHTEVEAAYYCQRCGKPCCNECIIQEEGIFSCSDCFDKKRTKKDFIPNPFIASLISFFIPGAGQIYTKQYLKGIMILITLFGIISMLCSEERDYKFYAIGGISLFLIWLLNIIDAYSEAKNIKEEVKQINFAVCLFWGIVFILVGIILLLTSFDLIPFYYFHKLWPLFFVIMGIRFLINTLITKNI